MERSDNISADVHQAIDQIGNSLAEAQTLLVMANDNPAIYSPLLEKTHEMQEVAKGLIIDLALSAVENKVLTRRAAAEMIGVHPITISRWLTAATVETPEESNRNYPPVTS